TKHNALSLIAATFLATSCLIALMAYGQERQSLVDAPLVLSRDTEPQANETGTADQRNQAAPDPAAEAVAVRNVPSNRPEQKITEHDRSPVFDITKPAPITMDLKNQAKAGRITGFDFARDPLNSDKPFT